MSDVGSDVPELTRSTEGDDEDHEGVPPDLLELYEVLEWERAVAEAGQ